MSKSLEDRLNEGRLALDRIGSALRRHPGKLPDRIEGQFNHVAQFGAQVPHWLELLVARGVARKQLDQLEARADPNDDVPYGSGTAKFQTVRLLGVQAYLSAQWALADRLVGMCGFVLCIRNDLQDPKSAPQLVSHFVRGKGPESKTAAVAFDSIRQSFGWPIAISYALRNHFLHDGSGGDFFEGPRAASAFKVSDSGWRRIQERCKDYNVSNAESRLGSGWSPAAGDDLRAILDSCAGEMDEALGILVGSACRTAQIHVGFLLGED